MIPPAEVLPGLWLGDQNDAQRWDGALLCVLESRPFSEPAHARHIPILYVDDQGTRASVSQLEECARFIEETLQLGGERVRLLVHCGAGMERSPLTLAWYLVTRKHCPDLDAAYRELMRLRPIVADRRQWLERMP